MAIWEDQDQLVILLHFRSCVSIAVASSIVSYLQVIENILSYTTNVL